MWYKIDRFNIKYHRAVTRVCYAMILISLIYGLSDRLIEYFSKHYLFILFVIVSIISVALFIFWLRGYVKTKAEQVENRGKKGTGAY